MTTDNALAQYEQKGLAIGAAAFDTSILAGTKTAGTIEQYRLHFKAYCGFAQTWANAINPATLARWRQYLFETSYGDNKKYSVNAINQRLAAIRGMMKEAAEQGYISHDLARQFKDVRGLRLAANRTRRNVNARTAISREDMQRIVDAPDTNTLAGRMHHALMATLATSGVRITEAVGIRLSDIEYLDDDGYGGHGWHVSVWAKGEDKPKRRALGKQAKVAIDAWLYVRPVESEFVFTGFTGRGDGRATVKPISRQAAWQLVQRYAAVCNLAHIKPHDFRRFVGTQVARKDIRLAQKQLGHKRIATTADHYVLDDVRVGITDDLLD